MHTVDGNTTLVRLDSWNLGHQVLRQFPALIPSGPNN